MLIYMFVYIYQAKFLIERYSFMDEKEKEPCRSWSQPRCVQWARHAVLHTQLRPQYPSLCLTSAKLGGPEGSAALSGFPATKVWEREWGDRDQKDWNSSSLFALTTRFELQPDELYHISKRRQEKSVTVLSFQLPVTSGCSGQKDTLPKTRTWKGDLAVPIPQPKKWGSFPSSLPPSSRSSHLALSLPGHLSSVSKPLKSPGPSCSFTVWFL